MSRYITDDTLVAHVLQLAYGKLTSQTSESQNSLDREGQLASYTSSLKSDWFLTAGDLRAAIHDEAVWSSLNLPLRLKLTIKSILVTQSDLPYTPHQSGNTEDQSLAEEEHSFDGITHDSDYENHNYTSPQSSSEHGLENDLWERAYCQRTGYPYFYHVKTGESFWDSEDTTQHPDFVQGENVSSKLPVSDTPAHAPVQHGEYDHFAEVQSDDRRPEESVLTSGGGNIDDSEFARRLQAQYDEEAAELLSKSSKDVRSSSSNLAMPIKSRENGCLPQTPGHDSDFDFHPFYEEKADIPKGASSREGNVFADNEFTTLTQDTNSSKIAQSYISSEDHSAPPPPSAPALPSAPDINHGNEAAVPPVTEPPVRSLNMHTPWLRVDTTIATSGDTNGKDEPESTYKDSPAVESDVFSEIRLDGNASDMVGADQVQQTADGITQLPASSIIACCEAVEVASAEKVDPRLPRQEGSSTNLGSKETGREAMAVEFMSGTLWKKSRKHALIGSKWQRRWFELRHDSLVYFQDSTTASPKNTPKSKKSGKSTLKPGMDVKLWWPNDSLWINSRILQCKSRDSFDLVILPGRISNMLGLSHRWVKEVGRERIRIFQQDGEHGQSNYGHDANTSNLASPSKRNTKMRYLGTIENVADEGAHTNLKKDSPSKSVHDIAGDDCNFPPNATESEASPKTLRGKTLLKRIPLLNMVAILRDESAIGRGEFAIALQSGRILELRASDSETAELWVKQLDSLIKSLSGQDEVVPLAPLANSGPGAEATHQCNSSSPAVPALPVGEDITSQIASDAAVAAKLQQQFDEEDRQRRSSEVDAPDSLLMRLAKGGATPPSTYKV